MNFEESKDFIERERKKQTQKKIIIALMLFCFALIILLIFMIFTLQTKDSLTNKMFINDVQEASVSSTLYKQIDKMMYVNLKEIAPKLGYQYKQGVYKKIGIEESSCYLTNNYEVVTFSANEETFKKYTPDNLGTELKIGEIPIKVKSQPGQSKVYNLPGKIQVVDGVLYAPFEALPDMFNAQVDLKNKKRIRIYTFEEVIKRYTAQIAKLGYKNISGDYENLKALLYGLAVVGNGQKFGVISLTTGEEIISEQCDDITFIQNLKHFLIKGNNEVGIISSEGTSIIKTSEYDEISVYDEELTLYLVEKNKKYGIVDKTGKVIIYPDYDSIGYRFETIKNKPEEYRILFGKAIPVRLGRHYGLFRIDGEELLPCVYDELGSKLSVEENKENNDYTPILLIPQEIGIKGIIVNQNGLYGLYDVDQQNMFIPIACTKAYSITKSGTTTYYVEHAGIQYDLKEYIEANKANSEEKIEELPEETTNEDTTSEVVEENTNNEENTNLPVENTVSDETVENSTDIGNEEETSDEENNATEENLNETIEKWRDVVE